MTILYHGTTNRLGNLKIIKPASQTKFLRESFRKKEQNIIFLTDSLTSAKRYAQLACETFSGKPIVYQVAMNNTITKTRPHEYTGKYAKVLHSTK